MKSGKAKNAQCLCKAGSCLSQVPELPSPLSAAGSSPNLKKCFSAFVEIQLVMACWDFSLDLSPQGGFITVKNRKVLCVRLWGLDIFFHDSLHLSERTYSSFDSRTWVG